MQWNIGFSRGNIQDIIRNRSLTLSFTWLAANDCFTSIADPFLFKDLQGNLTLLYEEFSMVDAGKYGKVRSAIVEEDKFVLKHNKEILDAKSHSSYPFIFEDSGKTYIIPETSAQRKVSAYEYDYTNKSLINEQILINDLPVLDSTIFRYEGKYWLFATLSQDGQDHSRLYIYYTDKLFGTYTAHPKNPVTNNADGSRPAGNIIEVDGHFYRPAQNCSKYYGESITINKITKLTETDYAEEFHLKIEPDMTSDYNAGVHTINVLDDIIVVDGIKMLFKPVTKLKLFLKKGLKT